jgi:hypothetical protein
MAVLLHQLRANPPSDCVPDDLEWSSALACRRQVAYGGQALVGWLRPWMVLS